MGDKTDALMQACVQSANRMTQAVAYLVQEVEKLTEKRAWLAGLTDDVGAMHLDLAAEEMAEARASAREALEGVDPTIAAAEKKAKDLESKVKAKNFLDHFKDQKSLGSAKTTLKATKDAVAAARRARSEQEGLLARQEAKADEQTDRLMRLKKAQSRVPGGDAATKALIEDYGLFVVKTVKASDATLGKVIAAIDAKAPILKKAQVDLKSKKPRTQAERKEIADTARKQEQELGVLGGQMLQIKQHLVDELQAIDDRGGVGNPRAKAVRAKAMGAVEDVDARRVAAENRRCLLAGEFLAVMEDAKVEGTDGDDFVERATEVHQRLVVLAQGIETSHTFQELENAVDVCSDARTTLAPWLRDPSLIGDAERSRIEEIARNFARLRTRASELDGSLVRVQKDMDGTAKRFKNVPEIQDECRRAKTALTRWKGFHDRYVRDRAAPEKAVAKLLARR